MAEQLHINLLGEFRAMYGGKVVTAINTPRLQELLAWLVLHRDNPQSRQRLSFIFWPDSTEKQAKTNLRNLLYQLREALPDADQFIQSDFKTLCWRTDASFVLDVAEFEKAIEAADKAKNTGDPDSRVSELKRAVDIYADPLLPNCYKKWIEQPREQLRAAHRNTLKELISLLEKQRDYDSAIQYAQKLTQSEPYSEPGWRLLMKLFAKNNDRAGVLKTYQRCSKVLREELDVEPAPETKKIFKQLVPPADTKIQSGTPVIHQSDPAPELESEYDAASLVTESLQVLSGYILVAILIFGISYGLTFWIGLPDWTISVTVVLLAIGVPIVVFTKLVEMVTQTPIIDKHQPWVQIIVTRLEALVGHWLNWAVVLRWNLVAFGTLILIVSGYMASRNLGIGPFASLIAAGTLDEKDQIVLADFQTQTVDSTIAYTITEAFRVDFSQSETVKLADESTVAAVLRRMERRPDDPLDFKTAREVAIREGYKAVAAGIINTVGSDYLLSIRLVGAHNGEELLTMQEVAENEDDIIRAIENLSRRLQKQIGESLKNVREHPPLKRFRTSSLKALKLYTAGRQALQQGNNTQCIKLMTDALAIDTLFASAYSGRGVCYWNRGSHPSRVIADFSRAFELRERMTPLGRVKLMDYYYLYVKGEIDKAKEALESHLALHPEDSVNLVNNLAMRYEALGQFSSAEKVLRTILSAGSKSRGDSDLIIPRSNLIRLLIKQGKFDEAEEMLHRFEKKNPESFMVLEARANLSFAQGKYQTAEEVLHEWRRLEPGSPYHRTRTSARLGFLAAIRGSIDEAESYFRDAMNSRENQGDVAGYHRFAHAIAAMHFWLNGNSAKAEKTLDSSLNKYPLHTMALLERGYHQLAIIYAIIGRPDRARSFIEVAEDSIPQEMQERYDGLSQIAQGWIGISEGRLEDAIVKFKNTESGRYHISQTDRSFALGIIYDRMGKPGLASKYFERFVTTPNIWWLYKGWWQARVLERLGQLYEERGEIEKAAQYLSRFVELWKDCDPELKPRVEKAREALVRLAAQKEG